MLKILFYALLYLWGSFSFILFISVFAPQSPVLIYFALEGLNSDIFAYDISVGLGVNLTNTPYPEWRGSWSETGVFAYTADASARESARLFLSQDFAVPQRPENLRNQVIFSASISPNGEKLLYVSSEPANYSEIYLLDLRSGEKINLSQSNAISESEPQWFGNEQLLFLREGNLYNIELPETRTNLLLDGNVFIENVLVSPNQAYLAFHGLLANERGLYVARSNGEALGQVQLPQSLSAEALSWSPDSQALTFTLADGSLNVYLLREQSLLSYPSQSRRSSPLWSPDMRFIAFMENRQLYLLEWQSGAILSIREERLIRPPLLWMP